MVFEQIAGKLLELLARFFYSDRISIGIAFSNANNAICH